MIGRERERRLLEEAVGGLLEGRGEVVLIAGEPGIGKTRLLLEASAMAQERDLTVAWGRASEVGGAPALWPWQQVLRELQRVHGDEAVVRAAGSRLPYVQRLVPGLAEPIPESALETASARFQMFDAVTSLLCELAPMLVILDDLHAADVASLMLLEHAAPRLPQAGIVLLASFRPDDAEGLPEVARILWRVARGATHVPLGRLATSEAEVLLETVLGREASDEEKREVMRVAEGSPLFVAEYARLLRVRGELPERMPPAIRHALEARIERVDEPGKMVLAALSVLGRDIDPQLLPVLSLRTGDLAPLEAAGFLIARERGWSFSHILLRDVLYQQHLSEPERRALHARVAHGLVRLEWPAVEVAHHGLLAGPELPDAELVTALTMAVAELVRMTAFDDAASLVARALAERGFDDAARAALLVQLGSARIRGGEIDAGRADCAEAAAIASRLGDDTLFARAALFAGADFTPGEVDPQLVALLDRAARLPLADQALSARVRARLAAALQPAMEPSVPMRLAHEAIALARETDDSAVMMDVLAGATSALAYFEAPAVRAPLDAELLGLAERAGDRVLQMRALIRLVYDELDGGNRGAAERWLEGAEALAARLGQPRFVWYLQLVRASIRAAMGQLAEADALMALAAELAAGDRMWLRRALFLRVTRIVAEDRDDEIEEIESELARCFQPGSDVLGQVYASMRAMLKARLGDRAAMEATLAELGEESWAEMHEMVTMTWLAEPLIAHGDLERVRALYRRLEPYGGWTITCGPPFPLHGGPSARVLGRLAQALDLVEEARAWLERAVAATRDNQELVYLARALVELGELMASDDAQRALVLEHAREAEDIAGRIGLERLRERAFALLGSTSRAERTRTRGTKT